MSYTKQKFFSLFQGLERTLECGAPIPEIEGSDHINDDDDIEKGMESE